APGFDDKSLDYDASSRVHSRSSLRPLPARGGPRHVDSNAHDRRRLTAAAWSGLTPAPGRRRRRVCLHLSRSLCTKGQLIGTFPSVRLRRTLDGPLAAIQLEQPRGIRTCGLQARDPVDALARGGLAVEFGAGPHDAEDLRGVRKVEVAGPLGAGPDVA